MNITVSIVEDDLGTRECLVKLIDGSLGYRCVSQHSTAEDALEKLPNVSPNVVLMDINLPGIDGIRCVRRLKGILPDMQVIMWTHCRDTDCMIEALAAGANGYLLKVDSVEKLLAAIKEVHEGGFPLSCQVAWKLGNVSSRSALANYRARDSSPRSVKQRVFPQDPLKSSPFE